MKTSVFIGRFSPFHNGHKSVVDAALRVSDQVIIVVGSSFAPRNARNPFTFAERKAMIKSVFPQVVVLPVADYQYNDNKWVATITKAVETVAIGAVSLVGYNKDSTSYYLNIFPNWGAYSVPAVTNKKGADINATDIRNNLFKNAGHFISCYIPGSVNKYLRDFTTTKDFDIIREEVRLVDQYKQSWEQAPYPVIFQTVDTVVTQSGHVLLVRRKSSPGAGLWALPGGFLNHEETLLNGALRELKEETKLKVPIPVLKGSIKAEKVFDDPNRSTRGRTITTAFYIDLGFTSTLSKVTGSDDAEKAVWVPFSKIDRSMLFEDHYAILDYFLGIS